MNVCYGKLSYRTICFPYFDWLRDHYVTCSCVHYTSVVSIISPDIELYINQAREP